MPAFAAVCGLLTALILFSAKAPARAAEPFVIDDTAVIERGVCKVEAGTRARSDGRDTWLMPACNLFLDVEVQLGRAATLPDESVRSSAHVVQVKGAWREIDRDGYGLGWVIGSEIRRHPAPTERRVREHGALLLASYPVLPDRLTVHANAGARWDRDEKRGGVAGGLQAELEIIRRVALLAEIYATSRARRGLQAGVRLTLVPDHVDLFFTRGGDDADENGRRYWAVSVELVAPKVTR